MAAAGAALARDPLVAALSFTGFTATGRRILKDAAESNFKRVSLEMGGTSPQVLMADALGYGDELIDTMVLEAGVISVNAYSEGDITTPFGGWKQSGFGGVERSTNAFDQRTREKTVWIRTR